VLTTPRSSSRFQSGILKSLRSAAAGGAGDLSVPGKLACDADSAIVIRLRWSARWSGVSAGLFINVLTLSRWCWQSVSCGRCHRGGGKRRAHHDHGRLSRAMRRARRWIDRRCDHRDHAGADGGVHPDGILPGSTGAIYRQFAVTLVLTMMFSALMALTLTPALVQPAQHERAQR